jgi:fructosamine-3-kinase
MTAVLIARLADILGQEVETFTPLHGGSITPVFGARLVDGSRVVVKAGKEGARLDIEGHMLEALGQLSHLPIPQLIHAEPDLVVMTHIANDGGAITPSVERHAAELLAALHGIHGVEFGFPFDTLIGGLHQPNPGTTSWIDFFRDQRLLYMGREALAAGGIDAALFGRIECLAAKLEDFIAEPPAPTLIHGDMWSGNVLVAGGRVAGFVDPACYYGDAEIELAFATLFGTVGEAFFGRYGELAEIRPSFFETRRDIYNLYPLLVHARLFGSEYGARVAATLTRFGF